MQEPIDNEKAKCLGLGLDPHPFFPDRSNGWVQRAKHFCNGTKPDVFGTVCPMRAQCLQYALDHNEKFGVWGGTSERERRKLSKLRVVAA